VGTSSLENTQITFKIPLSNITNGTIFWNESSQNKQVIEIQDIKRLNILNILVLDRFGTALNNNGQDWSMTLDLYT
jgi:hypothetical protein